MSGVAGIERAQAHRLLSEIEADANQTAFGDLIQLLLAPAERGIKAAFQTWELVDERGALLDPGGVQDEAFGAFLDKLKTSKFRAALAEASDPLALAFTSAKNLALDTLKKKPPSTFDEDAPSRSRQPVTSTTSDTPDTPLVRAQDHQQAATTLEQVLDELSLDNIILLEVAFAELRELPASHIEHLATRRGVTADHVRRELSERAAHQRTSRDEALGEHERRAHRLASLQREIRRVVAMAHECGDPLVEQVDPLSPERAQQLRQSNTALRSATAAERAAYLERLYDRERDYARLQLESRAKAESEWPAGKRYGEILQILGLEADDPAEQKKAVNATTIKLKRLLKRLRQRRPDV